MSLSSHCLLLFHKNAEPVFLLVWAGLKSLDRKFIEARVPLARDSEVGSVSANSG